MHRYEQSETKSSYIENASISLGSLVNFSIINQSFYVFLVAHSNEWTIPGNYIIKTILGSLIAHGLSELNDAKVVYYWQTTKFL